MAFSMVLLACTEAPPDTLQGYVEGEYVMLGTSSGGTLQSLHVSRGAWIEAGARVFDLEHGAETAARSEAAERLRTAQARLANLRSGRRATELEAINAQNEQARAARELSSIQLAQQEKLFAAGFISRAQLDAARSNHERDVARVAELQAQARLARQSIGREAEIQAAAAEVEGARAALAQADWRLAQRRVVSPAAGLVQDTFFLPGESVPPGRPVASLLPPGNIKVRFFVPEARLATLKQGEAVQVQCDGCPGAIAATIVFISSQAEFTPPVLYGKDSREKLVFMVEARPRVEPAAALRPGQPVDVTLASARPAR